MTGLDLVKDKLIEVAVIVTDSELNVLDPGLDPLIPNPGECILSTVHRSSRGRAQGAQITRIWYDCI